MREATEFVREHLAWLVLECIGIHRIEMELAFAGELAKLARICRLIPGDVQRNSRRRPHKFEDGGTVLDFFEDIARFAGHRKTGEARSSCANAPGWNGDFECLRQSSEIVDIDVPAMQLLCKILVIFGEFWFGLFVLFGDEAVINFKIHVGYLRKPSCRPPSTGSMWPVVFDNRFETKRKIASA